MCTNVRAQERMIHRVSYQRTGDNVSERFYSKVFRFPLIHFVSRGARHALNRVH